MRTLLELYKELLEVYDGDNFKFVWICNYFTHHFKDKDEKNLIADHFKKQRPSETQYQEFYNDPRFIRIGICWWDRGEREVRSEFIKAIIKKLETDV
jgi:aspartyl-tRNA synthetase